MNKYVIRFCYQQFIIDLLCIKNNLRIFHCIVSLINYVVDFNIIYICFLLLNNVSRINSSDLLRKKRVRT